MAAADEVEGIYLVQHYGSTADRGPGVTHRGFICVSSRNIEIFDSVSMPVIMKRARILLDWDERDEIPVFEAREDVFIYDGELLCCLLHSGARCVRSTRFESSGHAVPTRLLLRGTRLRRGSYFGGGASCFWIRWVRCA